MDELNYKKKVCFEDLTIIPFMHTSSIGLKDSRFENLYSNTNDSTIIIFDKAFNSKSSEEMFYTLLSVKSDKVFLETNNEIADL